MRGVERWVAPREAWCIMHFQRSLRRVGDDFGTEGSSDDVLAQHHRPVREQENFSGELLERSKVTGDSRRRWQAACDGYGKHFAGRRGRRMNLRFSASMNLLAGIVLIIFLMMGTPDPCWALPITSEVGEGSFAVVASKDMVLPVQVTNTTPAPDTTPAPEVECPSPPDGPCPVNQHIFLQPQRGPNRNYQQMGQIVTVSGVFFPEDCSKGCLFSPPCETCEMEVTYFVYFGTADAGCNFDDTAASACQCTPLSGQVTPLWQARKPQHKPYHPFLA